MKSLVIVLLVNLIVPLVAAADVDESYFREKVAPILQAKCVRCHNAATRKGKLALHTRELFLKGGRGGVIIDKADPVESELILAVEGPDPDMPKEGAPLSDAQVEVLREWIRGGAPWPEGLELREGARADKNWWSLRPLERPPVPELGVEDARWARTPIDAFIARTLREKHLTRSAPAHRQVLIRRLSFDLIGLPPTPAQIDAFLSDDSPDAYERLVDRLLASPRYGERWARHWLDVVHYGDTHGYDKDKLRPNAWPYRDYVIRAFNEDKPYGRFVEEQLAGDVLYPDTLDGVVATGFIAAGPWDFVGHAEVPEDRIDGKIARNLDRDDMVSATMNTFNSMTAQCARCHDHKFDPVTQEDYYSLQAVFAAVDRADRTYDVSPEVARRRRELKRRRAALAEMKKALDGKIADAAGAELTAIDERISALKKSEKPKTAEVVGAKLANAKEERRALIERATDPSTRRALAANVAATAIVDKALAALPPPGRVYAGTVYSGSGAFSGTGGKPREIRVLYRGDVRTPGGLVKPGTVPIIDGVPARFELPDGHDEGERRAALARWLTNRRHPLTWRSIVNRVWQYHFGRGIVDTPSDFGRMGQSPTHPELLDWLAVEFRDGGQSFKKLHRMIVTSSVYRQASVVRSDFAEIDGDNRYLWRMNRRRLDAESVRDCVLALSGKWNRVMYGPGFRDFVLEKPEHSPHYEYHKHDPEDPKSHRRSVYRFIVRSSQEPFMQTLDCADPSEMIGKRNQTLTVLQALALLNNKFMLAMIQHFAERLKAMSRDRAGQIELAYRLAIGRSPTPGELESLTAYAGEHGLANTCRVILNLNEFVFVD